MIKKITLRNTILSFAVGVFTLNTSLEAKTKKQTSTAPKAVSLFDGETLKGWKTVKKSNLAKWSVIDGVITCGDGKKKILQNTYLCTEKEYEDFEFRCLFRLSGDHKSGFINAGIQYRSLLKHGKIIGYQADIGKGYWGNIWDEHRRGNLAKGDMSTLKHILKEDAWNSYIIRCNGRRHELYINGVKTADYIERGNVPAMGVIAIQLHSGGKAKVEYKHLTITKIK